MNHYLDLEYPAGSAKLPFATLQHKAEEFPFL